MKELLTVNTAAEEWEQFRRMTMPPKASPKELFLAYRCFMTGMMVERKRNAALIVGMHKNLLSNEEAKSLSESLDNEIIDVIRDIANGVTEEKDI